MSAEHETAEEAGSGRTPGGNSPGATHQEKDEMSEQMPGMHEPPERRPEPADGRAPATAGAGAEAHGAAVRAGTGAGTGAGAGAGFGGAEPPRPRAGRTRRWVLGRPGAALVGVLVGALLATGVVAWRAGELPFLARDVCWGSLSPDTVEGLLPDRDIRSEELPLNRSLSADSDGRQAECSVQGSEGDEVRGEVVARVRDLERYAGNDAREWQQEFLSSRMAPLPGRITGMVSATRAWASLPASCRSGPDSGDSSRSEESSTRVVTLSTGLAEPTMEHRQEARDQRAAMARAVVELTNGVLAASDCTGRYAVQDGGLAPLPRIDGLDGDGDRRIDDKKLCGIDAARLPGWLHKRAVAEPEYALSVRNSTSRKGPSHSCDVGRHFGRDGVQLTTVEDSGMVAVVEPLARKGAVPLRGEGRGAVADDTAVFVASCRTGRVAFMAQDMDPQTKEPSTARALLPAYVEVEAERIGCGDVEVKPVPAPVR